MSTDYKYRRKPGDRYGYLELLEVVGNNGKHRTWKVKCHGCGKEYVKQAIQLREKRAQSCGCQHKRRNQDSPNWKGVGEMSSSLIGHYRVNAKRREIGFNITPEYMWQLYLSQNRSCALTGLSIKFGRFGRDECTASLDRKDSNLPYQTGNVQWVHKHVNAMKLNHDQGYFVKLCSLVSINQNAI